MGSVPGEDSKPWEEGQEPSAQGEKIFVAVRLRPLNEREITRNDASDWECINNTTIIFKNSLPERSMWPTAYTFDRVYGPDSTTQQVYEEAAKRVALSAVSGINSSIFAYGQTSSGKTYTMCGITDYAIADIYDYVSKHKDREFVLKFSAIEIYNECVRDLLSSDSTPLRLLDDPEKGTVIEKLTEVPLRDWSHLKELLAVCEAERQIGETSLNETSSRSHQILRLTVESSARECRGADNASTLTATVNFVDLAGSERASQTLSAGTRLKEGCHINRSLLTLGTVIRKLSKGRNGHVPYRDSKLTRILQHSLGGNARTAIICTMSPAHSHVEQSRNTLLFAICAKEVSTNAQVNVVMSEKALVKQLQRELGRLENELRVLSDTKDSASVIREKELQIQKMEKEIKELTRQRDLAESRLEELMRIAGIDQNSLPWVAEPGHSPRMRGNRSWDSSESFDIVDSLPLDYPLNTYHFPEKQGLQTPDDDQYFFDNISPSQFMNQYFGPDPSQGWEKIEQKAAAVDSEESCKEVRCLEKTPSMGSDVTAEQVHMDDGYDSPKHTNEDIETTADYDKPYYVEPSPCSSDTDLSDSRSINLSRSRSCRAVITTASSPVSEKEVVAESAAIDGFEMEVSGKQEMSKRTITESKSEANIEKLCRQDSHEPGFEVEVPGTEGRRRRTISEPKSEEKIEKLCRQDSQDSGFEVEVPQKQEKCRRTISERNSEGYTKKSLRQDSHSSFDSTDEKEIKKRKNIKSPKEEDIYDLSPTAKSLNIGVNFDLKLKFDGDKLKEAKSMIKKSGEANKENISSDADWQSTFEKQRRSIIELWDACNIPLLHRTYFFLLFKGDPSDSVYMEVELRRLSFLKKKVSPATSARSLNRERIMLYKKLQKKFSSKERDAIFQKWGIPLDSKNRRVQLSRLLWTKTDDIDHAKDSAEIVAKLVGLMEPNQTPKELFALSFAPREEKIRTTTWKHSMSFAY